jgi:hypothetical protein
MQQGEEFPKNDRFQLNFINLHSGSRIFRRIKKVSQRIESNKIASRVKTYRIEIFDRPEEQNFLVYMPLHHGIHILLPYQEIALVYDNIR